MKQRQYKKLCKKAAGMINVKCLRDEDGVFYTCFNLGYDSGCDSEYTWPFLVNRFNSEVNTIYDEDSDCGISWAPPNKWVKDTPVNVFAWARGAFSQ